MKWILCETPVTPLWCSQPMGMHTNEEAQVHIHDLNLVVTVQLLKETPAVLSLGTLSEDHGYSYEWVSGQKTTIDQRGEDKSMQKDNFVPLVVPGLSTSSGSNSSSTSTSKDLFSTSPAQERSDGLAQREWCGSASKTQNHTKKEGWQSRCGRPFAQNGWRSSQITWRTQNCLHPYTFLRTQIRNVVRKWYPNWGSTVFILTSQKTEIAKSACEPKWQGLLAQDAPAEALPRAEKFGDLIAAAHRVFNKGW